MRFNYSFYVFFLFVLLIFLIVMGKYLYIILSCNFHPPDSICHASVERGMWYNHLLFVVFVFGVIEVKCFKWKICYSKNDEMDVLTIYMGKPVISRYGLMKNKPQDWWMAFKNRVY